jgi:hypothetical protein
MEEEYVTTADAATMLGVNSGWVAALCRTGILEASGGGRGVQWLIKRSSVDELVEERSKPVDQDDLAAVAKEIDEDEEAQEFAKEKAEESFRDRVISICKRYGIGILCVVAGALGHVVAPGNHVSDHLIDTGITIIVTKASGSAETPPPPKPVKIQRGRKK